MILAIEDDEVVLAVLPFFHIYGMQVLMNGFLAGGATIVTLPRFDLEQALSIIQERRISRFYVVPPIVLALAKHPLVDQYDLTSLNQVFSGAAPLSAELAQEAPTFFFMDVRPDQVGDFRAMVEAAPGVTRLDLRPMIRGRIVRIADTPVENATMRCPLSRSGSS